MMAQPRTEKPVERVASAPRAEFIAVSALAFVASVAATAYFCRSMCCEMEMPGGWTMSMMWMRMPGQTWAASATSFQLMWLAMMVAMMLPSALPMFLNTKRAPVSLSAMAGGYFAVWLAAGVGIYALGLAVAAAAMRWENFSHAVPVLSGAALIAAGAFQFTRWKMTGLRACRSPFGCGSVCPERETNFRLGCKQDRWVTLTLPGNDGCVVALHVVRTKEDQALLGKQGGSYPYFGMESHDCLGDYKRMKKLGVKFQGEPEVRPYGTGVMLEDLYGNQIFMNQEPVEQELAK